MAWEIDAVHSEVRFSVRRMASSPVRGRFHNVRGYLHVDEETPAHSWVDVAVEVASLDTGNADYDARLRSRDALNVAEYPTITFKSFRVDHRGGQEYAVTGELTVHGMTREVAFDATFQGNGDANEPRYATLTASTTINCRQFGLTGTLAPEAGQLAAGDLARIGIDLALVSREPER
jgi:polyisoprenoid-binding protein YceI